jgi:hypothetical protein
MNIKKKHVTTAMVKNIKEQFLPPINMHDGTIRKGFDAEIIGYYGVPYGEA